MSETPLEKLIATMCDTDDLTDAEVREELAADGVDLDAAMARFRPKLDDLMRARAVRLALAALKANPNDTESPLPWQQKDRRTVVDADGDFVARCATEADAAHIAAAVNAAPVLAAEVEKLTTDLATLQARFDELHSAAQEVAEVANLRGEGQLNPCDDPILWTSRWNEALSNIAEVVENG